MTAVIVSVLGCDSSGALSELTPLDQLPSDRDQSFVPPPEAFDASVGSDAGRRLSFGEPCEEGSECESGFCIDTPNGRVCTDLCAGDCPDGFECNPTTLGGDNTLICTADGDDLCQRCESDQDCDDPEDLCLAIGNFTYCGEACRDDADCPESFSCQVIERAETETLSAIAEEDEVRQCVPTSGECAPCLDEDGDGYGTGEDCLGYDCADDDPARHVDVEEICDAVDNDCDSVIDEDPTDLAPAELVCAELGVCLESVVMCISGAWACNYPEDTYELEETACDGLDNDCDDQVDEALEPPLSDLQEGVCSGAIKSCEGEAGWIEPDYTLHTTSFEALEVTCDTLDNDCDGVVDEGYDLERDLANCGACGALCVIPQSEAACVAGVCEFVSCRPNFYDLNGERGDGCEYGCALSAGGVEMCDQIDNDCDGAADEDYDLNTDLNHCGACGRACSIPRASAVCVGGACNFVECDEGFYDINGERDDGCEYRCELTQEGVERCDTVDNDCDGAIDEDFDLTSDIRNCGACGLACTFNNAEPVCIDSTCVLDTCLPNTYNLNGFDDDGCEYECVFAHDLDVADTSRTDEDCDGVDGSLNHAVFVSSSGSDDASGLEPSAPLRTLYRALTIARQEGRAQIWVAAGVYPMSAPLIIEDPINIYGGYNAEFTRRDEGRAGLQFTSAVGVQVLNISSEVTLMSLAISVSDRANAGESAQALRVISSGDYLTVEDCEIRAGRGGDGNAGTSGLNGGSGTRGSNASGRTGGSGGSIGGGRGASGASQRAGSAGTRGLSNGSPCGGSGGSGSGSAGLGCADGDPRSGGNGFNGCGGSLGEAGRAGGSSGLWFGDLWITSDGLNGGSGGSGGGGGGGGAGGGEDCTVFGSCASCGTGRGGGGGGGGGAGGGGGTGGTGGGASFAIVVRSSTVTIVGGVITTANGGDGGAGGDGGVGGAGGSGGSGANSSSNKDGDGGDGGDGGRGGSGGCGGGGGGGPSVIFQGIIGTTGATINRVGEVLLNVGAGGQGGASCGERGANGLSATSDRITVN